MQAGKVNHCRLCAETKFDEILDLGELAFSGRFPSPEEDSVPAGPLVVIKCQNCDLVQLHHNFELDELFRQQYGYRSGINQSMRSHLAGVTEDMAGLVELAVGTKILDIGANDGTLLKSYETEGLSKFAVDPTISQFREYYTDDIVTVEDYFSEAVLPMLGEAASFDAITSIAVIYDLPQPQELFDNVARLLSKDGVWIFEQSYMPIMLDNTAYDTICHEHLEYYALAQIERLVSKCGLRMFDVKFNDMNGGSFRVFACHENAPYAATERLDTAIKEEQHRQLGKLESYQSFVSRMTAASNNLKEFLGSQIQDGKLIMGYGASTKGNILLQYCGITSDWISAIADRNPKKWGLRTPNTNIPIISEKEARDQKPDYFMVMPWHFKEEFLSRESEFLEQGGSFIFPLPELQIVTKSGSRVYRS